MPDTDDSPTAPALKDWFDEARFRRTGEEMRKVLPAFKQKAYLAQALPGLEELSLMQRLRRMTESLHAGLPGSYRQSLDALRELAPRIDHNFVTLVLPDYVGLYGLEDFEASMAALKDFTVYGSSEFAVREFLKRDLTRTLKVMKKWSGDEHEAVRRLASEGSRPRLPWSFRLEELVKDPSATLPILENLKADSSLYVRKSVANHLNDIAKDHPEWMMDRLSGWPLGETHTAWIAKRALRTLIKQGDSRALGLVGAGEAPEVEVQSFTLNPKKLELGQHLTLELRFKSAATRSQRLVVDYVIHYVKKSSGTAEKVFKWKELELTPGEAVTLTRRQQIKDFTTRVHYAGKHVVEVAVNGQRLAKTAFVLG